ncbi:MAG TPA: DUF6526 family protein [Candidatus Acidoferrales bacterium]|nr:DUF6526 family protein [Candidatus Acidoferrales bacterium]
MAKATQNFQNHVRLVPTFHFVVLPILLLNFVWSIVGVIRTFSFGTVVSLLLAIALVLLAFNARLFALTVQNRVIRLEMRMRLEQLLPADLRTRVPEFTVDQLVALRFAGDAELPELARKVLQENLKDRTAIKKLVRDWQADFVRA